jgi:cytochrome c oxidase assembly protein subunit 11
MKPFSIGRRNLTVAAVAAGVAAGALGLSFAAVPFYFAFCRATGFAGTTQVADHGAAQRGKRIFKVRFVANVAPGLDWAFEPESESVDVRSGATTTVFFRFRNKTDHETFAHAVYNVTPEITGQWFDKISCFCFTEQRLGPRESAELPVVFFLDPKLEGDRDMDVIHEITLSYTLFAPPASEKPVALAPGRDGAAPKL